MRTFALAAAVLLAFGLVALVPDAPWSATGDAVACVPHVGSCEACLTPIRYGPTDMPPRCI